MSLIRGDTVRWCYIAKARELTFRQEQVWDARTVEVPSGKRIQVFQKHLRLSFRQLFTLLENDSDFRRWYSQILAECAFDAFYWEHPPLSLETFDSDAEFVLLSAPSLAGIRPEPRPFESQFASQPDTDILVFPNLGGDALLIVPRPVGPLAAYPHLAAFLRYGPEEQVHALWQFAASAVRDNLSSTPQWLSTAGLGVAWLHLRLDTRPKYYRFAPYKAAG